MLSRREFLFVAGTAVAFRNEALDIVERLVGKADPVPELLAQDESFWLQVQEGFTVNRNIVNLNNGGVCPSPRVVQDALKRHLEISNQAPSFYMWRQQEPQIESVRRGLARAFGCDAEEVAITRNASEALEICLNGFDLEPGDEILTTTKDYPRMIATIQQRERREGVKMVQAKFPAVPKSRAEITRAIEQAITPKTKLILISQVVFLNGQILPVSEITALGRKRGIPVIVDGAHAFAQFPFTQSELGCDYWGTSLHKWLMAPIGTGMLYVKRERIGDLWPLMAAQETQTKDIRKFEEIGTHPAANHNAIGEALSFHEMIGAERKEARLRHLRKRWLDKLQDERKIKFCTNLSPDHSCGLTTVGIEGIKQGDLAGWLLDKRDIFVTSIDADDIQGIRVTPNVYTTIEEIDRFADAMLHACKHGIG
jgi:isopenicillin-N epimerase